MTQTDYSDLSGLRVDDQARARQSSGAVYQKRPHFEHCFWIHRGRVGLRRDGLASPDFRQRVVDVPAGESEGLLKKVMVNHTFAKNSAPAAKRTARYLGPLRPRSW